VVGVILNGKADCTPELLDALAAAAGPDRLVVTKGPGDATRAAGSLDVDRLWIAGGDGTIHEALQGLMQRPDGERPTVGILPMGTANDMARGLELLDLPLQTLVGGGCPLRARSIDVLAWGERYVGNQVTIGLPAAVTAETAQPLKDALGGLAYTVEGLRRALTAEPFPVTVRGDVVDLHGLPAFMVGLAVGPFGGGGLPVHPDASFEGGCLHVVAVAGGAHMGELHRGREAQVALDIPASVPVNLDGEPTDLRPDQARCVPSALQVLVPST